MATSVGSVTINDYTYILYDDNTCSATVVSGSKENTSLSGLVNCVYYMTTQKYYRLTSLNSCFYECTNLLYPPEIPYGVTSMNNCFYKCTSLKYPPKLPSTVKNLKWCFGYCSAMKTSLDYYIIPELASDLYCMFGYADGDDWASKICILSKSVTDVSYLFYNNTTDHGDLRGIMYNSPSTYTGTLAASTVDYGSELIPVTYNNTTINVWPIRVSLSGKLNLNLKALLLKLVTQTKNLSNKLSSSVSTLATHVNSNYSTVSRAAYSYLTKYSRTQTLRKHRRTIADRTDNYIAYYDFWSDGFCKAILYMSPDMTASQEYICGSKKLYNRTSAQSVTPGWGSGYNNLYNGTVWNSGLIQPQRLGNPVCMSGTVEANGSLYACKFQYFCTGSSTFTDASVSMTFLLVTNSVDNFYE